MKNGSFNENSKNSLYFINTKLIFNNLDNSKVKEKSRKSNSIIGAKNTPSQNKSNISSSFLNSNITPNANVNTHITQIPKGTATAQILPTEEKYTNINIIVNNNYIKSINETHTQSNFRNELLKMDKLDNQGNKNQKKNTSFHVQQNLNFQNKKNKTDKRIGSPIDKGPRSSKLSNNNIYAGFGNTKIKNSFKNKQNTFASQLKSSGTNSHTTSHTNSTANSNRKLIHVAVGTGGVNTRLNSGNQSRDTSCNNFRPTQNVKNKIIKSNFKESKSNSFVTSQQNPPEDKGLPNSNTSSAAAFIKAPTNINSTYIHNSYSQLAKKLKENKPKTGRTSFQSYRNNNNLYFNSMFKQTNKSNDKSLSDFKIKSYEERKKLDTSNMSELNASNMRGSMELNEKSHSNNISKQFEDTKIFSNPNNSMNSFHNSNNIHSQKDGQQLKLKQGEVVISKEEKLNAESSIINFKPIETVRNIEGPEELHYMYVNLNQQQKKFVNRLEGNEGKVIIENNLEI